VVAEPSIITEYDDLVDALVDIREAKGMSQNDVAKIIGHGNRGIISRFENKHHRAWDSHLRQYASAVGVEIGFTIQDIPKPRKAKAFRKRR
jgi:transcriptional regulator with XRE-family HTH domain